MSEQMSTATTLNNNLPKYRSEYPEDRLSREGMTSCKIPFGLGNYKQIYPMNFPFSRCLHVSLSHIHPDEYKDAQLCFD